MASTSPACSRVKKVKAPMAWAFSAAATSAGQLAASQAALLADTDFKRNFRLLSLMANLRAKLVFRVSGNAARHHIDRAIHVAIGGDHNALAGLVVGHKGVGQRL